MGQKLHPIFFQTACEKIFTFSSWIHLGASWSPLRTSKFRVLARLGALLDRFQFFLALLRRLLGPSGRRQGPPGGVPGAFWWLFFSIFCNDDNLHHKKRIF